MNKLVRKKGRAQILTVIFYKLLNKQIENI